MASLNDTAETVGVSHNGRRYVPVKDSGVAEGSFGVVHKCTVEENGVILTGHVALKVVTWLGDLDQEFVLAEKVALETISPHDGIIRLLDSWIDESAQRCVLYLVTPYFEHGNLLDYSRTHHIDDKTLRSLHFQFLDIIEHVHDQGYVFFDVKPDNMLLAEINPPKLVLADFGSARPAEHARTGKMISFTNAYAAPELRNPALRRTASASCDYFAWYMSLFVLMVVQDPRNEGKDFWGKLVVNHKRLLNFSLLGQRTTESFSGFLTAMHLCDPGSRKGHMTSHPGPWVAERLPVATVTQPAPAWPAPASFHLFAPPLPAPMPVAGPSTATAARESAAKRAGVEKCLQKEKAGKGSGVGLTASKRATSARKKAVKVRAAVDARKDEDGPAQAVLKRRAVRGRVSYKKFL